MESKRSRLYRSLGMPEPPRSERKGSFVQRLLSYAEEQKQKLLMQIDDSLQREKERLAKYYGKYQALVDNKEEDLRRTPGWDAYFWVESRIEDAKKSVKAIETAIMVLELLRKDVSSGKLSVSDAQEILTELGYD